MSTKLSAITKKDISFFKEQGTNAFMAFVQQHSSNNGDLIFILENIGHINPSFDVSWLFPLLKSNNETVRCLAVKNIAKVYSLSNIDSMHYIINHDESSKVIREAVSCLGRMRDEKCIPILKETLNNKDPKIVCQAIRGLLTFKGRNDVDSSLKKLINHENEMVRSVIHKEYFANASENKSKLPHTQTYDFLKNVVVKGDVRDILKLVPDDSIHLTFTSPPYYNARDYSIYESYEIYLTFLEEVFKSVFRVTKEGRFLIVNTSPVIVPRVSRAHMSKRYPIPFDLHHYLVKMGWEFIDDIVWLKPEYSVKNRIGGFQQHRKPLAYKPNSVTEYLMVYRKKTDKLLDWNMHQYDISTVQESKVKDGFETTNVWAVCPKSDKVHSAIFPVELCKRVIEYYSYKGDIVFDPFAGSGTFGRTAKSMNRFFFLTEKEEKYFKYMQSLQAQDSLFDKDATKFLSLEQFEQTVK